MRPLSKIRFGLSSAALLLCTLLSLPAGTTGWLQSLEGVLYDLRMSLPLAEAEPDRRIVIIDIDEASLTREGQWPWPRRRIGELIDNLKEHYNVSAIGLDIIFPEESRDASDDRWLAESIARHQVVTAQVFDLAGGEKQSLRTAALSHAIGLQSSTPFQPPEASGFIGNISAIGQHSSGGHISPDIDQDGKVRRIAPLIRYQDQVYPMLSLALLGQLFELPPGQVVSPAGFLAATQQFQRGPFSIPLDDQGRALIPYRGAEGSYYYVPAYEVLDRKVDTALLNGAIVLVGSSATGLFDLISTPLSSQYPGVEVHASLVSALLDNQFPVQPASAALILFLVQLLFFTLVLFAYLRMDVYSSNILPFLLAALWFTANCLLWQQQLALPMLPPLLLLFLLFAINSPSSTLQAIQQRQQIYQHFRDYVPRTVVDEIIRDHGEASLAPSRKDMTVLFMDVRGFTSISESLAPQQLSDLMNSILSPVTRVIHDHNGTVDKYIGDAVMAFWGAPIPSDNHATEAVQAALAIQQEIRLLNNQLSSQGYPTVSIGIGINSGPMTVGNMGSDFRLSYTVMGDAVNVASRLEGLTKTYKTDILLGGGTYARLNGIPCIHLGSVHVKGRQQAVELYSPDAAPRHSQPTQTSVVRPQPADSSPTGLN